MKINTKVIFEWNPESKQYEEIYCDSYDYDGEVDKCQEWEDKIRYWGAYDQQYSPQSRSMLEGLGLHSAEALGIGPQWSTMPSAMDYLNLSASTESQSMFGQAQSPWSARTALEGLGLHDPGSFTSKLQTPAQKIGAKYGALPGAGPKGSGQGFIGSAKAMTKAQFGQRAQGLADNPFLARQEKAGYDFFEDPEFFPGEAAAEGAAGSVAKTGADFFGSAAAQGGMMAGGALLGGITGFRQAKSQKKGLSKAIGELDPLKTQAFGAYERQLGLAEAYRPGGTYSRYMGGQVLSQAEEAVGQETSRMIASGITSPSMMRQMGIQSRRKAGASLPGMEMQVSQMALPYEQLAGGYFGKYTSLGEQIAGLKGARSAIDPWSSAISGAMGGAMGAATMIGSFASDRRMKKDIKYLHTSNEGHRVYSFKYKDGDTRYSGVMAQDVLKINPNAVTLKNGMFAVYYDMIDVDMQQLDTIQ